MRLAPLDWIFFGNTVRAWVIAAVVLVAVIGTLHLLKRTIIRRYAARAAASLTRFDDALVEMLQRTRFFFILFVSLSVAARVLELPPELLKRVSQVAIAALLVQVGIWASGLVGFWARQFVEGGRHADPGSVTAVTALGLVARGVVWILVALLVLANFDINVTALVAGLGVTGIAVALAVQSVLGDLLGALNIVVAKPFVVGETIAVNDLTGTVEYVGMRTTRLRSAGGEQLWVPNKQLLENTIRNYTRMLERRVALVVGLIYETPREVLARVPGELRAAVEAHGELVRFDRAHFRGLAQGSADFELVYWMKSSDYGAFMDVQQAVWLDVLARLERLGGVLAYPSQRAIPFETREMVVAGATSGRRGQEQDSK